MCNNPVQQSWLQGGGEESMSIYTHGANSDKAGMVVEESIIADYHANIEFVEKEHSF